MEASVDSCVHGFYMYHRQSLREMSDGEDRYAVAVYKFEGVVGHVPRIISSSLS